MRQRGNEDTEKTTKILSTTSRASHSSYSSTTNKDYEPKAVAGNGSGPLLIMEPMCQRAQQMGAAASMVVATAYQTLMHSLDEILPEPEVALPLVRSSSSSKKSQCFHYQPNKTICINNKMHLVRSRINTVGGATASSLISQSNFSRTISSQAPPASSQLLITFTLVAGICLIGAQCAPTTNQIKITTSQVKAPPPPPPPAAEQQQDESTKQQQEQPSSVVLIELAPNDQTQKSSNNHQQQAMENHHRTSNNNNNHNNNNNEDETILLVLTNLDGPSSSSIRRLIKRSGISDQRLAEIQMIRALKKQLEKAKMAASNLNSAGQESNSS